MTTLIKTTFIALAFSLNAGAAFAGEASNRKEIEFSPNASAPEIYQTIRSEAKKMCRIEARSSSLTPRKAAKFRRKCSQILVENAVNSMDLPALTTLHNER